MEVIHPCRQMPTRHCPIIYEGTCGEKPCARFESTDETPWIAEHSMSQQEKVKRTRR